MNIHIWIENYYMSKEQDDLFDHTKHFRIVVLNYVAEGNSDRTISLDLFKTSLEPLTSDFY